MKTIEISNSLYGAIWSRATEDDKTEEDILTRLLGETASAVPRTTKPSLNFSPREREQIGFIDKRFGIKFPQGLRIFRTYKGQDYRATASNGRWDLEGHMVAFDSLNALSAAVGAKTENAWFGWRYIGEDGLAHFVDELRQPKGVKPRVRDLNE
jgi:hypothetical protein